MSPSSSRRTAVAVLGTPKDRSQAFRLSVSSFAEVFLELNDGFVVLIEVANKILHEFSIPYVHESFVRFVPTHVH